MVRDPQTEQWVEMPTAQAVARGLISPMGAGLTAPEPVATSNFTQVEQAQAAASQVVAQALSQAEQAPSAPIELPKVVPSRPAPPKACPLTRIYSPDERGPLTYSATVTLGRKVFYILEMDANETKAFEQAEADLREKMVRISKGEEVFVGDEETVGGFRAMTVSDAAIGILHLFGSIVVANVVGQRLADQPESEVEPLSAEQLQAFYPATKKDLAKLILQKSTMGVDESDFLAC